MSWEQERIALLEEELRGALDDAREVEKRADEERKVFVAMLIRAAREIGESRLRASFLEELETMAPGSLEGLPDTLQPDILRRRARASGGPK